MRSPRDLATYSSTRTTTASPSRPMRRTSDIAFYLAAALSGIAAAYVLNEWVLPWWDTRHAPDSTDDETKPPSPPPTIQIDPRPDDKGLAPVTDPEHADPNRDANQTRSLPPLRTHSLPPPPPNGRAIFSGSSLGTIPDAMTSSTSLHTLSTQDDEQEDGASLPNTSDTDTEPFVDILSPPPAHVISRRRSLRNHDLFAQSHMSFSELGSLVAPTDDPERH